MRSVERLYDTSDPPEEIGLRFNGVGKDGFFEVLYADIQGNSWNKNRLKVLIKFIQGLIDVRIPLDDPSFVDDPDALTDPARPDFFHDGGDLVARSDIITDLTFENGHMIVASKRAR